MGGPEGRFGSLPPPCVVPDPDPECRPPPPLKRLWLWSQPGQPKPFWITATEPPDRLVFIARRSCRRSASFWATRRLRVSFARLVTRPLRFNTAAMWHDVFYYSAAGVPWPPISSAIALVLPPTVYVVKKPQYSQCSRHLCDH